MSLNSYRYRNGLPLATEVASIRPVSFVKRKSGAFELRFSVMRFFALQLSVGGPLQCKVFCRLFSAILYNAEFFAAALHAKSILQIKSHTCK